MLYATLVERAEKCLVDTSIRTNSERSASALASAISDIQKVDDCNLICSFICKMKEFSNQLMTDTFNPNDFIFYIKNYNTPIKM